MIWNNSRLDHIKKNRRLIFHDGKPWKSPSINQAVVFFWQNNSQKFELFSAFL
jgi:hypothetical protein